MNEPDKPSAIGETLKRIQEVEEENLQLRNKIQANIDLMTKKKIRFNRGKGYQCHPARKYGSEK